VTNEEKRRKASIARRLRENGVLISVDDSWQDSVLRMRQVGMPWDSRAFDLGNGGAGYSINVNTYIRSNNMTMSYIYLDVPWQDPSIALLCDPVEIGACYRNYRFYGRNPFEVGRARVLNHRIVRPELFCRGTAFQGLLLWSGLGEIPDAFEHAGVLPATVTVYDQFDDAYAFEFNLRIDRRNKRRPEKHARSSRPSLFSQRDYVPV